MRQNGVNHPSIVNAFDTTSHPSRKTILSLIQLIFIKWLFGVGHKISEPWLEVDIRSRFLILTLKHYLNIYIFREVIIILKEIEYRKPFVLIWSLLSYIQGSQSISTFYEEPINSINSVTHCIQ